MLTEYGVQVNKRTTGVGKVIVREFDGVGPALDSIRFWSLVFAINGAIHASEYHDDHHLFARAVTSVVLAGVAFCARCGGFGTGERGQLIVARGKFDRVGIGVKAAGLRDIVDIAVAADGR